MSAFAKIAGVSTARIRQLVKAGRIVPVLRIAPRGDRLFNLTDAERYARERAARKPNAA